MTGKRFMAFFFLCVQAAAQPRFDCLTLRMPGPVTGVLAESLDPDSVTDLIVVHGADRRVSGASTRGITYFLSGLDEGLKLPAASVWESSLFGEKDITIRSHSTGQDPGNALADRFQAPSGCYDALPSDILFDIADLESDGRGELVLIRTDGIAVLRLDNAGMLGNPEETIRIRPLLSSGDPACLPRVRFCHDWDMDSTLEIYVQTDHGIAVLARDSGAYALRCRLWSNPQFRWDEKDQASYSIQMAESRISDFNGDGDLDFLNVNGTRLEVFLGRPCWTHGREAAMVPPDWVWDLEPSPSVTNPLERLFPPLMKLEVAHLDTDACADVLLSLAPHGGFISMISQLQIFMNRWGRLPVIPELLAAENLAGEHLLADINEDGLTDIGMVNFKLSLFQAMRFFLTRKVRNDYEWYLMTPDLRYPKKPQAALSVTRRPGLGELTQSTLCHSVEGDFNGDGRRDLLVGTDRERFTVYPGTGSGLFSEKGRFHLSARVSNRIRIADFNGDGISDMAVWYPHEENSHSLSLLISVKK
ncbi:VCBS repeat-containing protein [bacterium]|nr:VCBS repeat-containing protein [bacterium]